MKKHYFVVIVKHFDMIDIKSKKCIACNIRQPYYNYTNEKQAFYCNAFKKCGMVNIIE